MAARPAAQAASVVFVAMRPMPSKSSADSCHRQVMRHHRAAAVALEAPSKSGTEHDSTGERNEPADAMHDRRAREVMKARPQRREKVPLAPHRSEPAVRPPGPVSEDRIDEARDADAVDEITHEAGASDHGARRDRRARISEGVLEDPDGKESYTSRAIGGWRSLQKEVLCPKERIARPEHEGEAPGIEEEPAQTRVHHALHEDVDGLPRAAEAGFEHREARLHAEDEECG